ncbi:MAG: DUF3857 and transglutaminase domain-containing protein, partial [Gemmatimonadetes bacterium]|nr:DUF3857 and transglutaminase domain-containing protein [Gemmatimonadota bacterium]
MPRSVPDSARAVVAALLVLASAVAPTSARLPSTVTIGPVPSWVRPGEMDPATPATAPYGGQRSLVREVQLHVERQERFNRLVYEVANESGLSGSNEISADYDPSHERLTIHRLGVHRNGRYEDRLPDADFQVIRQEEEIDSSIYNGTHTVLCILDDIRVGDRIEWAVSTHGENPALGGHFQTFLQLQDPWPVARKRIRVLYAPERSVQRRLHRTSDEPAVGTFQGLTELVWDYRDQPGVDADDSLPMHFLPYAQVSFTDFADWNEVARWASALYELPPLRDPDLRQRIEEWNAVRGRKKRTLEVLRFIQDRVNYLAVAIGPGSFAPTHPDEVFARRFGDCKDKSLLLASVLQECGVPARPALVNTVFGPVIQDWLPSAFAFNHVIVQVELGGDTYWLDPTISHQRGDLAMSSALSYGRALIISPE